MVGWTRLTDLEVDDIADIPLAQVAIKVVGEAKHCEINKVARQDKNIVARGHESTYATESQWGKEENLLACMVDTLATFHLLNSLLKL